MLVVFLVCLLTAGSPASVSSVAADAANDVELTTVPYRSDSGRFEVFMPGTPQVKPGSYATIAGRVHSTEYAVEIGLREFLIEHYDLPRIASLIVPDRVILRRAKGDFLESVGGRERAHTETTVQGHAARSLSFDLPGSPERVGEAILVLVARRLYLVVAIWPPDDAAGAQLRQMLRTFKVWER